MGIDLRAKFVDHARRKVPRMPLPSVRANLWSNETARQRKDTRSSVQTRLNGTKGLLHVFSKAPLPFARCKNAHVDFGQSRHCVFSLRFLLPRVFKRVSIRF